MSKDNVDLICSVAEITGMFAGSRNLSEFLQRVVETVARHMKASVCSIYLYDEGREQLVLSATHGLRRDSIGRVRLGLGEGITGLAVKELRAIREDRGSSNPHFKFIPDTEEERYEAFLAVPILRGLTRVGALVLQHETPGFFEENDTRALRAIASQLAAAIESARLLMDVHDASRLTLISGAEEGCQFIKGVPGSSGVGQGTLAFYGRLAEDSLAAVAAKALQEELGMAEFEQALALTEKQLEDLQGDMKEEMLDLSVMLIFSAHLLMLKDEAFAGEIREQIKSGVHPATAVGQVVDKFSRLFAETSNPRLQEKVQDIRDLGYRLTINLLPTPEVSPDYSGKVVLARELMPSDMLRLSAQKAAGLVLLGGGCTAHVAILARSLDMPLVVTDDQRMRRVHAGTELLVDAEQGTIYVNPGRDVQEQYTELQRNRTAMRESGAGIKPETRTRDGVRVRLLANINLLSELRLAKEVKAEGVGLYRSEFPYLVRNDFPSEEEQFRIYRRILDEMSGRDVVFRTLDIGGDKMLSYFPSVNEANPFLGLRAIRFSLRYRNIFSQQLRALLRAGQGQKLWIMFPLISSVDDFLAAREIVNECLQELADEGVEHNAEPLLGVMIELPAAVEIAPELAAAADFLCLGTNDLIQYMLAVDRTNQHIVEYFIPYHPAILRALKRVATAAQDAGKPLSLCGELATDARLLPFLVGIGINTLSMDARKIGEVQAVLEKIDSKEAQNLARRLLMTGIIREVEDILGI